MPISVLCFSILALNFSPSTDIENTIECKLLPDVGISFASITSENGSIDSEDTSSLDVVNSFTS